MGKRVYRIKQHLAIALGDHGSFLAKSHGFVRRVRLVRGIIVDGVPGVAPIIRTIVGVEGEEVGGMIHLIVPIITAPIDDFLREKESKHLHVSSGNECLCEDACVVVDWARQPVPVVGFQCRDTVAGPPLGVEHNIVSALVKVIAPRIICVLEQDIPHGRHVTLNHPLHFNELESHVLEDSGEARNFRMGRRVGEDSVARIIPYVKRIIVAIVLGHQQGFHCHIVKVG